MDLNYHRIEKAISYLHENFREQPDLEEVAEYVNLSPFHFQRLFREWAGVSPKKFLQYISAEHAKELLLNRHTLEEVSYRTGLSSTSRLHDLFLSIEAMTPGEFKNGGEKLVICTSKQNTLFGDVMVASTQKGICRIMFLAEDDEPENIMKAEFPNATIQQKAEKSHRQAAAFFNSDQFGQEKLKLHLKGTPFQLKIWSALLTIPAGNLTTYSTIAEKSGNPRASRAAGSAIGQNPIAYLIPCHRVIRSTGVIGNYRWGSSRKKAMIGWEAAFQEQIRQDN
jgi:AraC family transcriptional regulator, regulatory protein of adaptative response / methylated-DNA-[protein]-cysteine methyltransferase